MVANFRMMSATCLILAPLVLVANAGHLEIQRDVRILRPSLGPNEGYLNFVDSAGHGAEYTGHTDAVETSVSGSNVDGGRDWSDNYFMARNIVITDSAGVSPQMASPGDIANDYEFARKTYAQAGLSVLIETTISALADDEAPFSSLDLFVDIGAVIDLARSPRTDAINHYYVSEYDTPNVGGQTIPPHSSLLASDDHGSTASDARDRITIAHEFAHMLFNGPSIHLEASGDNAHSSDPTNIIAEGTIQDRPASLSEIGPPISNGQGGTLVMTPSQIATIHSNPGDNNPGFVKHGEYLASHGDVVDFDWVSDSEHIEAIAGDSFGADLDDGARDWMVWQINPGSVQGSQHTGPDGRQHDHGGTGALALDGYNGDGIRTFDVFSNINQYADNDASARAKALDYRMPEVSVDGAAWDPVRLLNVFVPGWTTDARQDDYVARFEVLNDHPYQFVRIGALDRGVLLHDGNAQIDGVVAVDTSVIGLANVHNVVEDAVVNSTGDFLFVEKQRVGSTFAPVGSLRSTFVFGADVNTGTPVDVTALAVAQDPDGIGADSELQVHFNLVLNDKVTEVPEALGHAYVYDIRDAEGRLGRIVDASVTNPFSPFATAGLRDESTRFVLDFQVEYENGHVEHFFLEGHAQSGMAFKVVEAYAFPQGDETVLSQFDLNVVMVRRDADPLPRSHELNHLDGVSLWDLSLNGAISIPEPESFTLCLLALTGVLRLRNSHVSMRDRNRKGHRLSRRPD